MDSECLLTRDVRRSVSKAIVEYLTPLKETKMNLASVFPSLKSLLKKSTTVSCFIVVPISVTLAVGDRGIQVRSNQCREIFSVGIVDFDGGIIE